MEVSIKKAAVNTRRALHILFVSKLGLLVVLALFVIPMAAFEAHVVNVTAVIERRPGSCDALSVGYWRNHDGCTGNGGVSIWADEINALSNTYSGAVGGWTGGAICTALWTPNCPSGGSAAGQLCRARAMLLGDLSNIVSGHLDINAIIAGGDDGSDAFDHMGLTATSTISQALAAIELIVADNTSTRNELNDAAHVGERLYAFYEDENPDAPYCVYDANWTPAPSPTPSVTALASFAEESSDASPTPSVDPSPTPKPKKEKDENGDGPSPTPSVEASPSPTTEPPVVSEVELSPTPTPEISPTVDPSPTPTVEPTPMSTPTPTPTAEPSPVPTPDPTIEPAP